MAKFGHKQINQEIEQAMSGGGQPNLISRMLENARAKLGGGNGTTNVPTNLPTAGIPDSNTLRDRGRAGELNLKEGR